MKIYALSILLLSGLLSFGQCFDHHQFNCEPSFDWPYEFDSQSVSTAVYPGKAFRFKVVLYENLDYFIGICKPTDVEFDNIYFRVTIDDTELDNDYATEEGDNLMAFELYNDVARIITVDIKVNKTQAISYTQEDLKCIGLIVGNKESEESY